MKIKITNGLKEDLEKVLCDNFVCMERGEYGRCYLDNGNANFKNCDKYRFYQNFKNRHNRSI